MTARVYRHFISLPSQRSARVAWLVATISSVSGYSLVQAQAQDRVIDEIIVTAQKREERLIDIPMSVTAIPVDDLVKSGATQFRDFADTIPGLSFQTSGPGYSQISLRGVSVGQDAGATVGIYVNDVPYGSSTSYARGGQITFDSGLFDLDRIEVLRGPQGTLYGASSMGGLIKYVTKAPDAKRFDGEMQAGFAGTQHGEPSYNVAAMVNAPISTDKAAVRASGFYTRDGGFIDNLTLDDDDVNGSDIYGGRAELQLTPTEALSIRLSGFAQNIERDGFALADYRLSGVPVDQSLTQRRAFEESFDQKFWLTSGTVTYNAGPISITSISSYQESQTDFYVDYSIAGLGLARLVTPTTTAVALVDHTATDKFAQEVRVASAGTHVLEWQIGAFFTREESEFTQALDLRDATGQQLPNNVLTFSTPTTYEEYAGFGDVTWHLTEKFDMTGGVRYARNRNRFEQLGTGTYGRTAPPTTSSDNVVTYLGNLRYHFSDQSTGYLRYATGYRPGGPNIVTINPSTGLPNGAATFDADELKSYEAGFKADMVDGRVSLDTAVYYIDWDNIIVNVTIGGFGARINAPGGAEVRGTELTLTLRPTSSFTATAAAAYQDAELSKADSNLRGREGERLPNVPRFTGSLTADYELPFGTWQPTVGAAIRYIGDRTASYDNSSASRPQYHLPEYTTVDVRAGFTLGSIDTQFYVRNLFDERAQLIPRLNISSVNSPIPVSIMQPRTLGVTMTTKF